MIAASRVSSIMLTGFAKSSILTSFTRRPSPRFELSEHAREKETFLPSHTPSGARPDQRRGSSGEGNFPS